MYRTHSFGLLVILLSLSISNVIAVVLQDLPHIEGRSWMKRQDDYGALKLRSTESFIWGGKNGTSSILGNLTVSMPGDAENIISMQRFKGMTSSVNCNNETNIMAITFLDDHTFQNAKNVWDWVNGADNHTFIMVAGTGDCGWNDHRVPFIISTITYDEDAKVAHLTANPSEWSSAVHTYTLDIGAMPIQSTKSKRGFEEVDFNKDLSLDFEHTLPSASITIPDPDLAVTFACVQCGTQGSFQFAFHLETVLLIPQKAFATLNPNGVELDINPKVSITATLESAKILSYDFLTIPIDGISIPGGILDIGPEIVFTAGVDIGPLTGSASISTGVSISLQDSAQITMDLLNSDVSSSSGWTPTVSQKPVVLDAQLTGEIKPFVKAKVRLAAKAFGIGLDAGVGVSPYISASLSAIASTGGACKDDTENHAFGVAASVAFGVEVVADTEADGQPILSAKIVGFQLPLAGLCLPFGPILAAASSSPSLLAISSSTTPASAIILSSGVKSSVPFISSASNATKSSFLPTFSPFSIGGETNATQTRSISAPKPISNNSSLSNLPKPTLSSGAPINTSFFSATQMSRSSTSIDSYYEARRSSSSSALRSSDRISSSSSSSLSGTPQPGPSTNSENYGQSSRVLSTTLQTSVVTKVNANSSSSSISGYHWR